MTAMAAAPLLCAGIIGYRCLRLVGIVGDDDGLPGGTSARPAATSVGSAATSARPADGPKRLAIYGFGSAASLCTQVAIWRGWEVYGIARDEEHRAMARELGAVWAGEASDDPGVTYDAAIVFAPAGELAVDALRRLDKGGIVALGGIYSSPIPPIEYPWIYGERVVRSVANSTRRDARELLRDAAAIPIVSRVQEYALEQANEALLDLKEDRVRGSAVLRVASD
jgi:propanol-preferring alcohol dehydrogenase